MENGLQKAVREAVTKKSIMEQNQVLRKGAHAVGSISNSRGESEEA
ncbi:MAG: hypothetical protein AAGF77_01555 [Bacteroidota bacterium]